KEIFIFNRFDGARELLRPSNLRLLSLLPAMNPMRSMARSLAGRFKSPHLVQLFSRFATYNGSDPYRAPSTLNLISHVEIGLGTSYPVGGMYAVVEALARRLDRIGV